MKNKKRRRLRAQSSPQRILQRFRDPFFKVSSSSRRAFDKYLQYAMVGMHALPEELVLPTIKLVLSVIPPFLFLVSAIIFVFGYFPRTHRFSLDIIEEIKSGYEETIAKRNSFIKWGMSVFLVGSISALSIIHMHAWFWNDCIRTKGTNKIWKKHQSQRHACIIKFNCL